MTTKDRDELAALINNRALSICNSWRPSFAKHVAEDIALAGYRKVTADDTVLDEIRRVRATHIANYCTRRIDHREGDYTEAQLADWEKAAAERWADMYPALAAVTGEQSEADQ